MLVESRSTEDSNLIYFRNVMQIIRQLFEFEDPNVMIELIKLCYKNYLTTKRDFMDTNKLAHILHYWLFQKPFNIELEVREKR